jgi:hypothetical protein
VGIRDEHVGLASRASNLQQGPCRKQTGVLLGEKSRKGRAGNDEIGAHEPKGYKRLVEHFSCSLEAL